MPPHQPPDPWLLQAWQAFDRWLFGEAQPDRTRGQEAEDIAARYLQAKGYTILERNWKCRRGELDLIARQGDHLIIVEVKSARADDAYSAATRVGLQKQRKLCLLTEAYMKQRHWLGQAVRMDVVEVTFQQGGDPVIRHFENAVSDQRRR
jgi:putative endonuclease